jgi:hypothetical protein
MSTKQRVLNEYSLDQVELAKQSSHVHKNESKQLLSLSKHKELALNLERKKKEKHRSVSQTSKKKMHSKRRRLKENNSSKSPLTPNERKESISQERSETRSRSMSDTSAFQAILNANKSKQSKMRVLVSKAPETKPQNPPALIEEENSSESDIDTDEKSGSSAEKGPDSSRKRQELLFEAGQPIIKAGTMESIVSWLLGCSGTSSLQFIGNRRIRFKLCF